MTFQNHPYTLLSENNPTVQSYFILPLMLTVSRHILAHIQTYLVPILLTMLSRKEEAVCQLKMETRQMMVFLTACG